MGLRNAILDVAVVAMAAGRHAIDQRLHGIDRVVPEGERTR